MLGGAGSKLSGSKLPTYEQRKGLVDRPDGYLSQRHSRMVSEVNKFGGKKV